MPRLSITSKYVNMTDINRLDGRRATVAGPAVVPGGPASFEPAQREHLLACVELLFFAYRDFTGDPDAVLEQYGFGRAHHRVLHFVQRNPGLRVAQLLDILKITKQSLARVLKQLLDEGLSRKRPGPTTVASDCCLRPQRAPDWPRNWRACSCSVLRRRLMALARMAPMRRCVFCWV